MTKLIQLKQAFLRPGSAGAISGPNVEIEIQADSVSAEVIEALIDRVIASECLPNLEIEDLKANNSESGLVHLFSRICIEIQLESRIPVYHPLSIEYIASDGGGWSFYLPSHRRETTTIAIQWTASFINTWLQTIDTTWVHNAVDAVLKKMKPFSEARLNPFHLIKIARSEGYPVFQYGDVRQKSDLLILGCGGKSRWLQSLLSDRTPYLSMMVSQNKQLTASILGAAGLPAPRHFRVGSPEEAVKAANSLGYPVVVKPGDKDQGKGVAAGLKTAERVAQAFIEAAKISQHILVEKWQAGNTHRLTVQDGQLIRAVRRNPGGVNGDGQQTIRELVKLFQALPMQKRLSRRKGGPLLDLDAEALELLSESGLSADSVPADGQFVPLRRRDNINAGGLNDELDIKNPNEVHPDNKAMAEAAATALRLDFAGIDFITEDLSRSYLEAGGVICEVNGRPQLGADHQSDVYHRILGSLFPHGHSVPMSLYVIPEALLESDQSFDCAPVYRPDQCVAAVTGVWNLGVRIMGPQKNGFLAATRAMQRMEVSALTCVMTPAEIKKHGLPVHHWNLIELDPAGRWTLDEESALTEITDWLLSRGFKP